MSHAGTVLTRLGSLSRQGTAGRASQGDGAATLRSPSRGGVGAAGPAHQRLEGVAEDLHAAALLALRLPCPTERVPAHVAGEWYMTRQEGGLALRLPGLYQGTDS